MIVEFIDRHRSEFDIEPVCAGLQTAPSTYWTAKRRPPSARAQRDAAMMPALLALWQANYSVYRGPKATDRRTTVVSNRILPPQETFLAGRASPTGLTARVESA